MTQHEHEQVSGENTPPDPTLVTVCTIAAIMDITKRTLNLLDGQGVAVVDQECDCGSVDDQISRFIYEGLNKKVSEVADVQQ